METKSCTQCGAPLASINSEEFQCEFCGRIFTEKREETQAILDKNDEKTYEEAYKEAYKEAYEEAYEEANTLNFWEWIASIIFPAFGVGLSIYYLFIGSYKKAGEAISVALASFFLIWRHLL